MRIMLVDAVTAGSVDEPVMVMLYEPTGVPIPVDTVSIDVTVPPWGGVTVPGENVAAAFIGTPEACRETGDEKVPTEVTPIVYDAV